MWKSDSGSILGNDNRAVARNPGILGRSRHILREAGALIVKCLQQVGTPTKHAGRTGTDRGPGRARSAERRRTPGETPSTRRRATYGRRGTPRWHASARPRSGQSGPERPAADGSPGDQPSEATIARLLRQQALRIAHSADPVDALAGVIDLVIESSADPYHLIGVLAEGAVQIVTQRIPSERRRDTAMALVQLMLDRLQFGRM